jgi:hypothetical protein
MPQAIYILFGAVFTVFVATAIGRALLRWSGAVLFAQEETPLGFAVGSGVLSLIVFLLASAHLARKGAFLAIGLIIIAAAWKLGAFSRNIKRFDPLPRFWRWLFVAGFGAFTILYFCNAMAPEFSPDGVSYHLIFVARYIRAHGFVRIPENMYSYLSQGLELLFVFAFAFGKHSAAALVHYAFLVALAILLLNFGRRIGRPAVGAAAALLVYASPVAGIDGTSAYIDVGAACVIFAVFYLLQIWDEARTWRMAAIAGLTAGFAYAVKYTAFLAVPYAIGFVLWRARRLRPAIIVGLCSLVLIVPWMAKDLLWTGNPFSPMLNRVFPNPWVHISFEREWGQQLRMYGLQNYWQLPLELTVRGEKVSGMIGIVFVLIPVSLLALRSPEGRRVLLPALLFTLPYFANVGARFFIPPLPFWSLAIALTFAAYPRALAAIAAVHCVLCWPSVMGLYASPYAWRLEKIPAKQAFRIEKEESWLGRKQPEYKVARMIEAHTPPGARIFAFEGRAESYTTRDIAVGFQSAQGQVLRDVFWAAFTGDFQPRLLQKLQFSSRQVRRFRVVQTAQAVADEEWAITELRVFSGGRELPRAPQWRLTSRPNPWDIQLAFDNSPVTRWRTWEPFRPGQFVEVDLGSPSVVDEVRIETTANQATVKLKLESMDGGSWRTIANQAVTSGLPSPGFLGKAATAEIKARGYDYILVQLSEWGGGEVMENPGAWGLTEVANAGEAHLYRIDASGPELAESR